LLNNHIQDFVAIDFLTVPTATFRVLFVLVVVAHYRRRIVHFQVTKHPTGWWTGPRRVETFPEDTAPRYLLWDGDKIYGEDFGSRVKGMDIQEVTIAPYSPWQNPFAERLAGSLRRECLDHVIVLGEKHLRRILKSYFDSDLGSRTHLCLAKDAPTTRVVQGPEAGEIAAGRWPAPSLRTARCVTKGSLGLPFPYLENNNLPHARRALVGAEARPAR
jgi:transposase InsO family protein